MLSDTAAGTTDSDPGRWRMLRLLALAELLGMSLWFTGSAIAPQLQERWSLTGSQVDGSRPPCNWGSSRNSCGRGLEPRGHPSFTLLFAAAAVLGGLVNAAVLFADGFPAAVAARFACGFCLAGVYPPAMKMIATWFKSRRGLAVGTIVGALTVGKATPYLVHAFPGAGIETIVLIASLGAFVAALLVWLGYATVPIPSTASLFVGAGGPVAPPATLVAPRHRRLSRAHVRAVQLLDLDPRVPRRERGSASGARRPRPDSESGLVGVLAFGTIAMRWRGMSLGRPRRGPHRRGAVWAMAAVGGRAPDRSLIRAVVVAARALRAGLGFFVIADSAQFSQLVKESVPSHAVGTALMIQTSWVSAPNAHHP